MEEKNEFSDIVLEKESEAKASKFKKIALTAAIFILIFLSVLIVMKVINKPDKQDDSSRLTIQPQTTTPQPTQETKADPLFKQVPIIEEDSKKESFEEMVKKLKERESQRKKEQKLEVAQKEVQQPKEKVVPIVKSKPEAPVKVVKPTKKEKATTKPKTQTAKKTIPTIPSPKKTKSEVAKGMYIQVTATSKAKPDSKYLASLTSKGYKYHLYSTMVKNKKYIKILVGPYKNSDDAKTNLAKVKKELNKDAFIFRVP